MAEKQNPQMIFEAKEWRKSLSLSEGGVSAGIDEVGVESLVGPMTAAVVVLPEDHGISELPIDSKKLNPETVQILAKKIKEKAIYIRMFYVDGLQVDKWGTHKTRIKIWIKCANTIRKHDPNIKLILDGKDKIPHIENQKAIIGADNTDSNVSAASIIAKAFTDNELAKLHEKNPMYNLKKHKGYGTDEHIDALKKHGISEVHRPKMTKKAINHFKPREINLSEEEWKEYMEQCLGFAEFGTTYISEWACGFIKKMKNMSFRQFTPKMQYYVKDIYKSGVKNAKRAGVKLEDIPPISMFRKRKQELSFDEMVSITKDCIALLTENPNRADEWGKTFIKSIIKQINNQRFLTEKQQYNLQRIHHEISENKKKEMVG